MIVRLVKMTFRPEEADHFRSLFETWRHRIISFSGCLKLELLHDSTTPGLFFTCSEWASTEALENYRSSAVFAEVWPIVKALFAARAEAWTLNLEHRMHADRPADNPPIAS